MIDITTMDLELQAIELLPAREALGPIWIGVNATNLAIATNTGVSIGPFSGAHANAAQFINVGPVGSIG